LYSRTHYASLNSCTLTEPTINLLTYTIKHNRKAFWGIFFWRDILKRKSSGKFRGWSLENQRTNWLLEIKEHSERAISVGFFFSFFSAILILTYLFCHFFFIFCWLISHLLFRYLFVNILCIKNVSNCLWFSFLHKWCVWWIPIATLL